MPWQATDIIDKLVDLWGEPESRIQARLSSNLDQLLK